MKWFFFTCGGLIVLLVLSTGCSSLRASQERRIVLFNEGNTLKNEGRLEGAIELYREALDIDPEFRAASFNLSLSLVESGQIPEGIGILVDLLTQDPENLTILRALGWASALDEDYIGAIGHYSRLLELFPADKGALEGLADVLDSLKRSDEALVYRQFLVDLDGSIENRLGLARTLSLIGNLEYARNVYAEILVNDPENPDALSGAAEIAERDERYNESVNFLERAVLLAEGEAVSEIWWNLGRIYLKFLQDYQRGFDALESALVAGFDDVEKRDELILGLPLDIAESVSDVWVDVMDKLEKERIEAERLEAEKLEAEKKAEVEQEEGTVADGELDGEFQVEEKLDGTLDKDLQDEGILE